MSFHWLALRCRRSTACRVPLSTALTIASVAATLVRFCSFCFRVSSKPLLLLPVVFEHPIPTPIEGAHIGSTPKEILSAIYARRLSDLLLSCALVATALRDLVPVVGSARLTGAAFTRLRSRSRTVAADAAAAAVRVGRRRCASSAATAPVTNMVCRAYGFVCFASAAATAAAAAAWRGWHCACFRCFCRPFRCQRCGGRGQAYVLRRKGCKV